MHVRSCSLAAFLLTAWASSAAADVLTVGLPGSGADFASIDAALAVSAENDTVFVLPGQYDFGFNIDGQSARIVGAGADLVFLRPPADLDPFGPAVRIDDVAPNQAIHIAHLTILPDEVTSAGIRLERCDGPVTFADIVIRSPVAEPVVNSFLFTGHAVNAINCEAILMSRCTLTGADFEPSGITIGVLLPAPIELFRSHVTLDSCTVQGCHASGGSSPADNGGAAVNVANDSSLEVRNSTLIGGNGGQGVTGATRSGGAGVEMSMGTLTAGANTRIVGGMGALSPSSSAPGSDAIGGIFSTVVLDSTVLLEPGFNGAGTVQAPETDLFGGSVTTQPGVFPNVEATSSGSLASATLNLDFTGEPGTSFQAGIGLQAVLPTALVGFDDDLWLALGTSSVVLLPAVSADASGLASQALGASLPASLAARAIVVQGLAVDPVSGMAKLTGPSVTTSPVE